MYYIWHIPRHTFWLIWGNVWPNSLPPKSSHYWSRLCHHIPTRTRNTRACGDVLSQWLALIRRNSAMLTLFLFLSIGALSGWMLFLLILGHCARLLLFLICGLEETRKHSFRNLPRGLGLLFCLRMILLAFFLLVYLVLARHLRIYFCFLFLFSFWILLSR